MVLFIALGAFLATMLGGLFALRLKDRLHLILGFSAGAIVGIAFLDLLPEAVTLASAAYSIATILSVSALGFVLYLILDRLFFMHSHDSDDVQVHRGQVGAGSLSFHSLLDGIGIGLAFKLSPAIGLIVAAAVLTHDFSDGINTVNLMLRNGASRTQALRWLLIDAVAPVVGVLSTWFFSVPEATLGMLLALFAGFFLYIGASDLVPESHHAHPTKMTTVMTALGIAVIYVIVRLAS